MIAFTIPGEPQGKGRPRVGRIAGHASMFTPAKTAAYEGLIAHAAQQAMAGAAPVECACAVQKDVRAQLKLSQKTAAAIREGRHMHSSGRQGVLRGASVFTLGVSAT